MSYLIRPTNITIDRAGAKLALTWVDHHVSEFPLRWLRTHCPCATCREARRSAAMETDLLKLSTGPLPSTEIANAALVGNYALRLVWTDGHDSGIYAFTILRASCPCPACHPDGLPETLVI